MHNKERIEAKREILQYWAEIAHSDLSAPETIRMAKSAVRKVDKEIAKLLEEEMKE